MFQIGDVTIPNRVVLAPMAGVSNWAFRLKVKEFGEGLVCAEMVTICLLHADRLAELKTERVAMMEM
ncbi:hypothetical protein HMI01_16230 [Halolactibacillus miurensis]|uniref:Dihydrouridine synthase (Dus) n=1 Tax=Halolactibacillus miurensis TaxID=306541 RepID=A0A1I6TFW3_9BACI|nr:hypothetical protein HMI01_16230 [Halolactibacillus miurensis]SFS88074.1 Dihydrouridine synthase (Dus) [Halolactibacillus miurensis]